GHFGNLRLSGIGGILDDRQLRFARLVRLAMIRRLQHGVRLLPTTSVQTMCQSLRTPFSSRKRRERLAFSRTPSKKAARAILRVNSERPPSGTPAVGTRLANRRQGGGVPP